MNRKAGNVKSNVKNRLFKLFFFVPLWLCALVPALLFAENVLYYQCDAQGTPVAMTDAQGEVVWQGGCSPFGENFQGTGAWREPRMGYCGKLYDHQLGLYDFGARYYDPAKGRFTGVDPITGDISDSQRLNGYAYALNNPYKYVDPDGRSVILAVAVIGAIAYNALSPSNANAPDQQHALINSQTDMAFAANVAIGETLGIAGGKALGYGIGKLTGKAATEAVEEGTHAVYRSLTEAGEVQYVGITNNFARRAAEHVATKGIDIQPLMSGLSRTDARAVEQALIEIHGLGKEGGALLNKINSIAKTNPTYANQLKRGAELLESIGYK